jgi:hypothetical protein
MTHFTEDHEQRCGRAIEPTGFFTDIFADVLSIKGCANREEAYSVLEALRMGAAQVLDMERDDLQVLVIGQSGSEMVDALLYDPMPGGSGLLQQICARFDEVIGKALQIVSNCPSACARACIDCLCTFRNAYFHRHLDRHLAHERLSGWGPMLEFSHNIPQVLPSTGPSQRDLPVNNAEATLRGMLQRAGFAEPDWHHQLNLGRPLGTTTPDCFFPDEDDADLGLCVYLDGLSEHYHGNAATQQKDMQIRQQLRAKGYHVIEIAASDLTDKEAMRRTFYKMGQILLGKAEAKALKEDISWFGS